MDWLATMKEPSSAPEALAPEDNDDCYYEEDGCSSVDEGMVRVLHT